MEPEKRDTRVPLAYAPWHFLYFLPLPQGQGSLRPVFWPVTTGVAPREPAPPAHCNCSISRYALRRLFRRAGKTLLCVSHGLGSLEILCDRAMWLSHGRVAQIGTVKEVLQAYREMSPSLVGESSAV